MGQILLQIPQTGQLNSTEDPKISSDFTTLQTVINGNLDDTNLVSPNNTVRRVVLQTTCTLSGFTNWTVGGQDFILPNGGSIPAASTVGVSPTTSAPPLFIGDAGISGQPVDYQVASKTARARVKIAVVVNGVQPLFNCYGALYQITGLTGSSSIAYTFGAGLGGSGTATLANPAANIGLASESPEFGLPASGFYALGLNLSGGSGTIATNSIVQITAFLLAYNS